MSLYHEAAEMLSAEAGGGSSSSGGSLKSRVFSKKGLKSPPAQVFALATETCKWSEVLKEVVENAELLRHERKLSPVLALLLVHDLLLAKSGIALPASHGLRATVHRHKGRLASELTRARLRREAPSLDMLRAQVDAAANPEESRHPRWVRVNSLKANVADELESTFGGYRRVLSVDELMLPAPSTAMSAPNPAVHIDEHVPNLLAVSPGVDLTKTEAYRAGRIILQDKASCFPAYLLDPHSQDGDVVDSCAAPGNKTTHLAAIMGEHRPEAQVEAEAEAEADGSSPPSSSPTIFAFERDQNRAKTLGKMVKTAGSSETTRTSPGKDFLHVDPEDPVYRRVGALLLDPSCSGSGIVGRDSTPALHLPEAPAPPGSKSIKQQAHRQGRQEPTARQGNNNNSNDSNNNNRNRNNSSNDDTGRRKRKRDEEASEDAADAVLLDDDGNPTVATSQQDLQRRLRALSSFQLALLLHAMRFPSARKISYSTCSVHAEENEGVVMAALRSDVARTRGWRVTPRDGQVRGVRDWPCRGLPEACGDVGGQGAGEIAEACVRTYKGDGRGVMGFFVVAFERDDDGGAEEDEEGKKGNGDRDRDGGVNDGPYVRDEDGAIIRDVTGMPVLKSTGRPVSIVDSAAAEGQDEDDDEDEWEGFGE